MTKYLKDNPSKKMPIHSIDNEHPSHARQVQKIVGNKVCKAYYKLDQKLKVNKYVGSCSSDFNK